MAEQGFTSHGWLVERRSRQYFVSLESGIIRFSYFRTPEQGSPGFVQSDNEQLKNTFGTPESYEIKRTASVHVTVLLRLSASVLVYSVYILASNAAISSGVITCDGSELKSGIGGFACTSGSCIRSETISDLI